MRPVIFAAFFVFLLLVVCSCNTKNVHFEKPAIPVNHPYEVGNWNITMSPKESDPNSSEMVDYNFSFVYLGNSKIKNAIIQVGNEKVELRDITYGQGGVLGSSFPNNIKQIDFTISVTEENGHGFQQTLTFTAE